MRLFSIAILAGALLALAGCGYRPTGEGSLRLAGDGTIGIPQVVNKAYRPHLGVLLTDSLLAEFARRTGRRVLSGEGGDFTVLVTIVSYRSVPVAYGADDRVRLYQAVVAVTAALREEKSGRILWKGELSQADEYPVNTVVAFQQNSEEAALREICARLAERLYQKLAEDF